MTKVTVSHIGGMAFEGKAEAGQTVIMDASQEHGGERKGMGPMSLVLNALGGCTGMDVIDILRKKRMDVTGYHINITAERAEDHPRVFTSITVEHVVRGRNVRPAAVERAIELSTEKYCSVMGMLSQVVDIKTTYRILEEHSAPAAPEAAVSS